MEGYELRRRIATFRGIPWEYLGSSRVVGRRQEVHEFAKRDLPYTEDNGRRARTFSPRGAVIGGDHDLEAERLEAAFEKEGPGELVLPHRAPIMVSVLDATFDDPERETRIQRFTVEFVESGRPTTPQIRPDTAGVVVSRVDAALAAIAERFEKTFTIGDQVQAAVDRVVIVGAAGAVLVESAFVALKAAAEIGEEIAAYADEVDALVNRVSGTIVDAAVTAREFQTSISEFLELPFLPVDVYRELAAVVAFGDELVDPGSVTVARRSAKRNQDSLVAMVRQSAIATRAKALSRVDFESSTEAAEFRDEIAAELAAEITSAADALADDVVAVLRDLRTAVLRDLDARSIRLPARVEFIVPFPMPALVVAQRLYGDPARDAEIIARNRLNVRNPGRIAAGTVLEVLADE